MRDENLPILPQWNDALVLPPSFDAYQESIQKDKLKKESSSLENLPLENND